MIFGWRDLFEEEDESFSDLDELEFIAEEICDARNNGLAQALRAGVRGDLEQGDESWER